ncbi:MAG: pilin [Candidatus Nanoperiomorbaceae bacterium]
MNIRKIMKRVGVALAFVPMLSLVLGGFGSLPAGAAVNSNNDSCANVSLGGGVKCGSNNSTPTNLFGAGGIFQTVINILLFIIGILSVIMIIYSGIRYATSAGDTSRVTNAKNTLMYSIVGLVIAIFAYAIVNWVVFATTNTTN